MGNDQSGESGNQGSKPSGGPGAVSPDQYADLLRRLDAILEHDCCTPEYLQDVREAAAAIRALEAERHEWQSHGDGWRRKTAEALLSVQFGSG